MQLQKENEIIDTAINFAEIPFDIKKDDLSRYGDANLECYEKLLLNAEYEFDFKNGKVNSEILDDIQNEKTKRLSKEKKANKPKGTSKLSIVMLIPPVFTYLLLVCIAIGVVKDDYKACKLANHSSYDCVMNIAKDDMHQAVMPRVTAEMERALIQISKSLTPNNNQGENK